MKTVSKETLKAKMLEYFREVERTGEPLVVTDQGREVLEVRPIRQKSMTSAEVLLVDWLVVAEMDWENRDPADRIIAATAIRPGVTVVTVDEKFHGEGSPVKAVC